MTWRPEYLASGQNLPRLASSATMSIDIRLRSKVDLGRAMPGFENMVAEAADRAQEFGGPLPADVRAWTLDASAPPLFIEPQTSSVRTLDGFIAWARENLEAIEALLTLHGGLVFRGFAVRGAEDFSRFVRLFDSFATGYVGGANVRRELAEEVYEASQYAAPLKLPLHQEMAYAQDYPGRAVFFCRKPAERGGETIICDMRQLTRDLPEPLREKLEAGGVSNVRNFTAPRTDGGEERATEHPDQKSWKTGFFTDDRREVEEICGERGMKPVWHEDGSLTVTVEFDAFTPHPVTGERIYRSNIHLDLYSDRELAKLPREVREPIQEMFGNQVIKSGIYLGDGTELSDEEIDIFTSLFDRHEVSWLWQPGDIMLLDNLLTAHGRNPYEGTRDVQVGLLD